MYKELIGYGIVLVFHKAYVLVNKNEYLKKVKEIVLKEVCKVGHGQSCTLF